MHSISNLHSHPAEGNSLRISNPILLKKLCDHVFRNDAKGQQLVKKHLDISQIPKELPEPKVKDQLFYNPY